MTSRDVGELINCVEYEVMRAAAEPTRFVVSSISGTIDPFTEEVNYHTAHTYYNASGVLGAVTEKDQYFGQSGKVEVGMAKITYLYDHVSGILPHNLQGLEVLAAGVSGLYEITGRNIDVLANRPVFVDFFLVPTQSQVPNG